MDLRKAKDTHLVIETLTSIGCVTLAQRIEGLLSRGYAIDGYVVAAQIDRIEFPELDLPDLDNLSSGPLHASPIQPDPILSSSINHIILDKINLDLSPIFCTAVFDAIQQHPDAPSLPQPLENQREHPQAATLVLAPAARRPPAPEARPAPTPPLAPPRSAARPVADAAARKGASPLLPAAAPATAAERSSEDAWSGRTTASQLRRSAGGAIPDLQVTARPRPEAADEPAQGPRQMMLGPCRWSGP